MALPASAALAEGLGAPEDHQWQDFTATEQDGFLKDNPGLVRQMYDLLSALAKGNVPWSELLSLSDWDLVEMGNMTMTFVMQGRFPQAEEAIAALCDLSPTTPIFWLGMGDVLEELGKTQAALDAFATCISLSESIGAGQLEALLARLHRGAIYFKVEMPEEAGRELIQLLRSDPEPAGDRASTAAMGLQALLNDGKLSPDQLGLEPGAEVGNGWSFEGGNLAFVGSGPAAEVKALPAAGTRLFASSQLNQSVTYNSTRFRADQNSFRVSMKFANFARPHYKRTIAKGMNSGNLPSAARPAPDKARQRLLGVLAKRRYEEMRAVYHRLKLELVRDGRLSAEEAAQLSLKGRRMHLELRNFYKHRAAAAQLDRNYRNSQTVEFRASRVRGGAPNQSQSMTVNTGGT